MIKLRTNNSIVESIDKKLVSQFFTSLYVGDLGKGINSKSILRKFDNHNYETVDLHDDSSADSILITASTNNDADFKMILALDYDDKRDSEISIPFYNQLSHIIINLKHALDAKQ